MPVERGNLTRRVLKPERIAIQQAVTAPESNSSERNPRWAQGLSRWKNEGGAGEGGTVHPASTATLPGALPLTNIELVQLQIRVITLENLLAVLLAEAAD